VAQSAIGASITAYGLAFPPGCSAGRLADTPARRSVLALGGLVSA
jgi:hypothetical protein